MDAKSKIDRIYTAVRKDDNFVRPTNPHRMDNWAADTWQCNGVTVQLMDGGYTRAVRTLDLQVFYTGDAAPTFYKGGEAELDRTMMLLGLDR